MPETSEHASAATTESTVLDQSTEAHLDKLYRAAVGPIRTEYYLPLLSRFESYGRASPSWNWAACVCTLNWMVFRGLWLPALAYLGAVGAAVAVLGTVIALTEPPMATSLRWSLWAALATMGLLIPGFFGNAWFYRVYRKRVSEALGRTARLQDACMLLARQSSTRQRLMAIVSANLALLVLLTIVLWPSDMPMRMQPRVSGTVANLEEPASAAVADTPETETAVAAAPAPAIATPSSDAAPAPKPMIAASEPPSTPAIASAPTTTPASTPIPAPAIIAAPTASTSAPSAADRQGRFLINVGLFAQPDNALRVHTKLTAAGLPVISTSLETGNGTRTRVRVGPFTSRAQADAAAEQIRALQLDAVVIRQ